MKLFLFAILATASQIILSSGDGITIQLVLYFTG